MANLGSHPSGPNGYPYRPSEEEAKLEVDVNSPLSDEDNDEEEDDDFRNIKNLIKESKKFNKTPIREEEDGNSIEQFLVENNLTQLSGFVKSMDLTTLNELKHVNMDDIRRGLGSDN